MRELQERSDHNHIQLLQQLMDQRREAENRAEAQRQEEHRLQAEREAALQQQISQLDSRERTVVHSGSGSKFPWGTVITGLTGALAKASTCNVF
jgi:hypothetical protein